MIFDRTGEIHDGTDPAIIASTPLYIEQLSQPRETSAGAVYNWTGVAPIDAAAHLVGKRNRMIKIGDRWLRVIGASELELLPHVELFLSDMRGAG